MMVTSLQGVLDGCKLRSQSGLRHAPRHRFWLPAALRKHRLHSRRTGIVMRMQFVCKH